MVNLYVAITDKSWFDTLSRLAPDEVNFWQPSGRTAFHRLQPGELLLFKLHAPLNYIVGGGVFSHASNVPLSLAWEAFGQKNGVASQSEMLQRIAKYRRDADLVGSRQDPTIGCRILTKPFFWPRELWLPVPTNFARSIVQGKRYSTDTEEGRSLWDAVSERLENQRATTQTIPELVRFGPPALVRPRLGQGAFRLAVTDGYERRCAVSGEKTLPILDAAHIRSYADGGSHDVANGLLLRTDIHRLFDLGYVTVTNDNRFQVSARLKADFDNGKHYYALQGQELRRPRRGLAPPAADALTWHQTNRYLG